MENFGVNKLGLSVSQFDYMVHGDNCGYEWKNWMRSFECCMKASGIKDEDQKCALLLHFAGPKVQEVFATLTERVDNKVRGPLLSNYGMQCTEYEKAVDKLNEFFLPKKNITYERYIFRGIHQEANENIAIFALRLRVQAEQCDFGNGFNDSIKEVLISNCDEILRKDLMKLTVMRDVDLESLLKAAKGLEAVNKQSKAFKRTSKPQPQFMMEEVNRIETKAPWSKFNQSGNFNETKAPFSTVNQSGNFKNIECYRCGKFGHMSFDLKCPAKGKLCNHCGGRGHFMSKCRSIKTKQNSNNKSIASTLDVGECSAAKKPKKIEIVKYVSQKDDADSDEEYVFIIHMDDELVLCSNEYDPGNEIECKIGGIETSVIIDSGSRRNLMDQETWEMLKSKHVVVISQRKETDYDFKAYGGRSLTVLGVFETMIEVTGKVIKGTFYVVKEKGPMIVGRITAFALEILKIGLQVNTIDENNKNNDILGKIKGVVVDIPIENDVKPVQQPYRRVPVALEKVLDQKVEELLKQGIIEEVNEPSRWISPVVLSKQGNGYRFCIDMRRANEPIERENYPLPTMEEFLPSLNAAKWFSKLDIRQAFHQVEISQRSREITTFMTRKGLFRYKRLMFGVTCAPELFQKILEQILSRCDGCLNFIDDIIIHGSTKQEHDERVKKVLDVLKEYEVTLKQEKCIFGVNNVVFLGHILSEKGISPTMDKVLAVKQFREPNTVEEVRSFLGLVNYIGKFIPNLATVTDPLRSLTKKNAIFIWKEQHREAFKELKNLITSDLALGYYNVDDETQLYADASPVGLGAVLVQFDSNGPRVISYANKSLSEVEKRYAQTEKEALALIWATERFHFYLYGREFELVTDHKLLEVIFGPRSKPCARIERWVLRLQSYKYRVKYRPGKNNIADPLSRLVSDTSDPRSFDESTEEYVNWVVSMSAPVAIKLCEIEEKSIIDDDIQAVRIAIYEDNWTEKTKPFKIFETELCFAGQILLRGTRIVMPKELQQRVLELAHEGHPGMTVMKRRLRAKVWWPKIDEHVDIFVKKCRGCQLVSVPSAPEQMKRRQLPSGQWQHLAIDFMGPLPTSHSLFVIVDYYSRYIEIEIMTKPDTKEAIKRLNIIFARFGLPLTMTADNGAQFVSEELDLFCTSNNITLNSTIPYWPQQNGEVERQNRSILKWLQIAHETGKDWRDELLKFLVMYRSTPHSVTMKTPSELMFGRNIRDKLPNIYQPLEKDEEVSDRDKEKKEKGKQYADERRKAKESNIQVGDEVLVKRMKKTNKLASTFDPTIHEVVGKSGAETVVQNEMNEKLYRRNVAHLKKINDDEQGPTLRRSERLKRKLN